MSPPFTPVSYPGRIASLDGWRAIAIGLVLLSHTAFAGGFPARLTDWWLTVFNGDLGVRVFFVLSGFLITSLLEREHARTGTLDLRAFIVRRALRIWPVYFACLAVIAACQLAGWTTESPEHWLQVLTFTRSFGASAVGPTVHFWSLAVEEQFYIFAPLTLLRLDAFSADRRKAMLGLAVVALVAPLTRFAALELFADGALIGPRSIFRYSDALAVGCLAALGRAQVERALGARSTALVLALGTSLVVGLEWLAAHFERATIVVPTLEAPLLALMMVASARALPGAAPRVLNSRVAARLGVLSYSLYVWHGLFLVGFMGPGFGAHLPWHYRAWFLGVFLVANVSYVAIERPFLRLKDTWRLAQPRAR